MLSAINNYHFWYIFGYNHEKILAKSEYYGYA